MGRRVALFDESQRGRGGGRHPRRARTVLRGGRSFPLFPVRRVAGRYEASAFWLRLTGRRKPLGQMARRSPSPRYGSGCRDRSLFFWGMMAQRFDKYLPTARGARPLSTLSQRAVYALWRADLIRHLEAIAKSTSADRDWQIAIQVRNCSLTDCPRKLHSGNSNETRHCFQ